MVDLSTAGIEKRRKAKESAKADHVHKFGPFERSRFAGTLHRKCQVPGCRDVSLDGDEEA